MILKKLIVLILVKIYIAVKQSNNDYDCSLSENCTRLDNCNLAIEQVRKLKRHSFKRCGFDGLIENVCCPLQKSSNSSGQTSSSSNSLNTHIGIKFEDDEITTILSLRKSQIACNKYLKEPWLQKKSKKSDAVITAYVFGGTSAEQNEFPHMAALGYLVDDELHWLCGGSLISPKFVITAAHCTVRQDGIKPTLVQLGKLYLYINNYLGGVNISRIINHPDYKPPASYNDIALIELQSKVSFSENVHPACIHADSQWPKIVTATGWGYTSIRSVKNSDILMKVNLSIVGNEECNNAYNRLRSRRINKGIIESQICAGSDDSSKKDTCQGDSGGPIQFKKSQNDKVYIILGITSFGVACGSDYPGVYTKISDYLPWIENIVF